MHLELSDIFKLFYKKNQDIILNLQKNFSDLWIKLIQPIPLLEPQEFLTSEIFIPEIKLISPDSSENFLKSCLNRLKEYKIPTFKIKKAE
jgi:hypothetical protein